MRGRLTTVMSTALVDFLIHTKLLYPFLSPGSQIAKIVLGIVAAPVSQCEPEVARVFAGLDSALVVRCIEEEGLQIFV